MKLRVLEITVYYEQLRTPDSACDPNSEKAHALQRRYDTRLKTENSTFDPARMKDFYLMFAGKHWELTEADHPRSSAPCATKDEALQIIQGLLIEDPVSLKIRRIDGTVEEEWSFPAPAPSLS